MHSAVMDKPIFWQTADTPSDSLALKTDDTTGVDDRDSKLRFASIHSNGMVLQAAPLQATVWGFGGGADVEVAVDDGTAVKATRSLWHGQDTWMAKLPPLAMGFSTHTISASSGTARAQLTDVLAGDVFVCAGQSNMNYPLNAMTLPGRPGTVDCWDKANVNCTLLNDTTVEACKKSKGVGCNQCHYGCVNNSQAEINDMKNYDKLIRMNVVAECGSHMAAAPRPLIENANTGWLVPSKMGGGFSAACYFWARDMAKVLQPPRPIGLLQAAVGGTSIQFWSSDQAIAQCQAINQPWEWPADFRNGTGNLSTGYKLPDVPSGWNGKIVPLLRTVIRAAVWYQVRACLCRVCSAAATPCVSHCCVCGSLCLPCCCLSLRRRGRAIQGLCQQEGTHGSIVARCKASSWTGGSNGTPARAVQATPPSLSAGFSSTLAIEPCGRSEILCFRVL